MRAPATMEHVLGVLQDLSAAGLEPCLFGGWAKELHRVWHHGAHGDIDVLVRADTIAALDAFLRERAKPECLPKHHVHKRAYWHDNVLVELFHVGPDATTNFYGEFVRAWRDPLGCKLATPCGQTVEVATADNIVAYEGGHDQVEAAFYAAFPAVRDEVARRYGDLAMPYHKFFPAP